MLILVWDVKTSWLGVCECRSGTAPTRGTAVEDGGLKDVVVLIGVARG